jgi:hypothetical protein
MKKALVVHIPALTLHSKREIIALPGIRCIA